MNDGLSHDIKKKFMLPLTIELHDSKEKCFITPQSPLLFTNQCGQECQNLLAYVTISYTIKPICSYKKSTYVLSIKNSMKVSVNIL